jgi:hypothetical protein
LQASVFHQRGHGTTLETVLIGRAYSQGAVENAAHMTDGNRSVVAVSGDGRNVLCAIIASNKSREACLLEAQSAQPKPFAIRDDVA